MPEENKMKKGIFSGTTMQGDFFETAVQKDSSNLFPPDKVQQLFRGCFLLVDRGGNIVGDKQIRHDIDGCETWLCEYTGTHVSLRRVHPDAAPPVQLPVDARQTRNIEAICDRLNIEHASAHEAGHAIMCYAVRLGRVAYSGVMFSIRLHGNLYEQIENRKLDLRVIKGVTSLDVPFGEAMIDELPSIEKLKVACYGWGGIAGCKGNKESAEDDIQRFAASTDFRAVLIDHKVQHLREALQNVAKEIMRDPIVSPLHTELARNLSQNKFLDQTAIEAILTPDTLPDYSPKILEIGRRFKLVGDAR